MGYADKLSVAPGESIEFKISSAPEPYQMSLVRLGGVAPSREHHHGSVTRFPVENLAAGTFPGRRQTTAPGSFGHARFPTPVELAALLVEVWCLPTRPQAQRQVLLASREATGSVAWTLSLEHGVVTFAVSTPTHISPDAVSCALPPPSRRNGSMWWRDTKPPRGSCG
jgi:N,N-dimethylformamidase